MRLFLGLSFFLLFSNLYGERLAAVDFSVLQPQSLEIIQSAMADESLLVQVHAGEELLRLGYGPETARPAYASELKLQSDVPVARVLAFRVLSKLESESANRSQWIDRIKAVFADEKSPDRIHAVETLGKLEVQLDPAELAGVQQFAQSSGNAFAYWVLAQHGQAEALEQLRAMAQSAVPLDQFRAQYCLYHLETPSDQAWRASGGFELAQANLESELIWEQLEAIKRIGVHGSMEDARLLLPFLQASNPDLRIYSAAGLLELSRKLPHRLAPLDWGVILGYFAGMLLIGWLAGRKAQSAKDYFLGGGNMKPWMVGLSLFATLLSTATYMSMPGEIIKHGPMIAAGVLAFPFVMWAVGRLLIPAFMKLEMTTANELLESRLGLGIRMLGSFMFLLLRLVWMAMVIYITVKAVLGPILGFSPAYYPAACLVLGVITVIYTSMGGIRAVVLTDVIQTFILFLGSFLTLIIITWKFGGFGWFPLEWQGVWDAPVIWFDPDARITFAGVIMMTFLWYICTSGSDQMAVQRYLSTKDVKSARSAFNISLIANFFVIATLVLLGFALQANFKAFPNDLAGGMQLSAHADMLFPRFIMTSFPVGITGLVVAALLAASMSSLSSGLSAACSVVTVDLFDRFSSAKVRGVAHLKRARIVSWALGMVVVLISLGANNVQGNLTEVVNKTSNLLVAPLFVIFFMAIFIPFATPVGVWVGALASVAVAVAVAFYDFLGLSFIWIMPLSLAVGVVLACLISFFTSWSLADSKKQS